jgi:hypothetical protein
MRGGVVTPLSKGGKGARAPEPLYQGDFSVRDEWTYFFTGGDIK